MCEGGREREFVCKRQHNVKVLAYEFSTMIVSNLSFEQSLLNVLFGLGQI